MDKYYNFITKHKFFIETYKNPIPNREIYSKLDISFDRFSEFISYYLLHKQLPLLMIKIYDEDIILTPEDINKRYQFLKLINSLNIKSISFNLSDSTLSIYNKIMTEIGWKYFNSTKLYMTVDRNPKTRKKLELPLAQGKLMIPEEKLIWETPATLTQLKNKVNEDILMKFLELKEIVFQYYYRINSLYHTEYFTEFDKVWLAYDFIKRHITFAQEATRLENGKQILYNPGNIYDWVSEPLGTYKHKKGVCKGQARLMQALTNNQYFRSDTVIINGECPLGSHVWVGSVIDDKLFQTCLTMSRPFKRLESFGYISDDIEFYPKLYRSCSLDNEELLKVQVHLKKLKRR